ncbi:MAG TPA: hypothetical protein ENK10_09555 [Acidobacteria bacterium]|nr:hypothetical protein [Acidobacteriota bacterium]
MDGYLVFHSPFAARAALSTRITGVVAVSACVTDLSTDGGKVPSEILLVPAGRFRARDGRPEEVDAWRMDEALAARAIAFAEAAAGDFVIDYEHQTLNSQANGQPAPAAGWFKRLEWREGEGLFAVDVRWTERARQAISAGEYRYISPVFEWDRRTGEVLAVLMAALTNFPAIDGHSDLAARAAARFHTTPREEDDTVNREQLIALLGLEADASDEQIIGAIEALNAKARTLEEKETEIAALKAAAQSAPDPAKYVPVTAFEALKSEVAGLRAERLKSEVAALVAEGLETGKLVPSQEEWATQLGEQDIDALRVYLENTPAIAALRGTQTGGQAPEGDGENLGETEMAVCRQLGLDPETYRKAAETH